MAKLHEPTAVLRTVVLRLAKLGHTRDRIAYVLKITRRTLGAHYAAELSEGSDSKNETVEQSLFEMATGKELATGKPIPRVVAATIFWLKARAGWKEAAQDFNLNGRVVHATRADLSSYSDDELRELRRIEEQRESRLKALNGHAIDAAFIVKHQSGAGPS